MEVEHQEVSGLVAAVAAAVEAATSETLPELQPLFAEAIFDAPESDHEAEAVVESEVEAEDEDEVEAESEDEESVSKPVEFSQWVDEIDNIQYHYTHDDDDRGYNFFRDIAGNTLYIQEFDIKGTRFLNINREHIMKYEDFFNVLCAHKEEGGVNMVTFGQQLLKNCSTDLLVEALTILADSDDSVSDTSSESSTEDEPVPVPVPEATPVKGDSESVQNFLLSFFLVLMCIRAIGFFGQFV